MSTIPPTSDSHRPPLARGWPLLGAAWHLWRDPLAYLREAYARHGDIFEVRAAHRDFVVIAGRDANRFVATRGRDKLLAGGFWGRYTAERDCPHMMLAVDGPDHKVLRRFYQSDLSRRVVDDRRDKLAAISLEHLEAASERDQVEVLELVRILSSRQVYDMMTHGGPAISPEDAAALREAFRWETNALLLGKWPRIALRAPQYKRMLTRSVGFLDKLIEDYEDEPPPGWFANTFRGRAQRPDLFSHGDVRAAFMLPFVAGIDTVGSTLGFLIWEVFRDPELLERLRAAVDTCFREAGGDTPPMAALKAVPELDATVRETMRLHPAAFAIYRTAADDFEFAGHRVDAGRDVLVFTTATHTDPRYFDDPLRFDIDRFMSPRNEHKQGQVLAPFGGGPHICLGAGMGESQLLLTAATIVRGFDVELVTCKERLRRTYDPSLSPPPDFRVRVLRRAQNLI